MLRLSLWYAPRWLRRRFVPLAAAFAEGRWKVRSAAELGCFVSPWHPDDESWLAGESARVRAGMVRQTSAESLAKAPKRSLQGR